MKLKLRKIGNSVGVLIPSNIVESYNIGDLIDVEVITNDPEVITKKEKKEDVITKNVITPEKVITGKEPEERKPYNSSDPNRKRWWCHPHGKWNLDCGC